MNTNTKRVALLIVTIIYIMGIVYSLNVFIITHKIDIEQIDEIKHENMTAAYPDKYFVVKDESFNGFYDGFEYLSRLLPDYDKEKLDTDNYTYFVSLSRKINLIKYNGSNCKARTYLGFPETYSAIIDCDETMDETIRIYRMRKINIDFDYHSGEDAPDKSVGQSYLRAYLIDIAVITLIYWGCVLMIFKIIQRRKITTNRR
ncbi:MAG: hypothetical protein NC122_01260 [Faecalibacterium sp.]|nr:hypothetical protein [Ruminococcus sp.]MCM1392690.1 hypothetical protein [Ruminococcus sp.]MCM1484817.1 hypothetical protein [Faecalibacterium sp.]